MTLRKVDIPGIGVVNFAKRARMRNIRITVLANGTVRVNLPRWASFFAADRFVKKNSDWILRQKSKIKVVVIKPGDKIGRSAKVHFNHEGNRTIAKVSSTSIKVSSPYNWNSPQSQKKLREACEASLKLQAHEFLPDRIDLLSKHYGLKYNELRIRKMTSRWGSCSTKKNISLSIYLMQLPDKLIEYVIAHELAHTKHMNHSPKFWLLMEELIPNTRKLRKEIRRLGPSLRPERTA